MILEVKEGRHYWSRRGYEMKVLYVGKSALDCTIGMITYTNLTDTFDSPPGVIWSLPETIFLERFSDAPPTENKPTE